MYTYIESLPKTKWCIQRDTYWNRGEGLNGANQEQTESLISSEHHLGTFTISSTLLYREKPSYVQMLNPVNLINHIL